MKLEDVYIISNSPYLEEGANIINSIRTGVDFKEFVAFLPLAHYTNELFKYQSGYSVVSFPSSSRTDLIS